MAGPTPDGRLKAQQVSRYPGVQPFGDDDIQRMLFRGRDEEKYELLQLVLAERLTLIFARSGIGKSSLINAGLLEPLRDRGYFPMVVRVSGSASDPVACLYEGIKAAADKARAHGQIDYEPPESDWNRSSLWHFFKTFELWQGDRLLTPVLVIDQFEELFTLSDEERRKQLIHELADLVRGTRPRETADPAGPKLSEAPPDVKVVLSLREDFYANLEELRDRIPSIYKAPFRLKPLSREQAARAIVEPAELEGEQFRTPAFSWSEEALGEVLDFLSASDFQSAQQAGEGQTQAGREVEPFQLQLICQYVEEKVSAGKLEQVSASDLGGAGALKAILSDFYESTLRNMCELFPQEPNLREKLEHLCEYGFITAKGRRLLREESTIKQDDDVGPDVLRELVELRLLRKEPRVGDNYYELTHDTLIEPIQLSRQAREEKEAREAWAAQKKMRKQFAAAGVLATFVLLATGSWALWEQAERRRVDEAKQEARAAQQRAEEGALRAELEAKRALEAKQKAVAEKQASVKVAVQAKLEAGEEGAKRRLAEAEVKLAEVKPVINAAQKKLAEATVQATEAEGQDYEEDAKRLVADAQDELKEVTQQLDSARAGIYEANKEVALAEVKSETVETQSEVAELAEIEQQIADDQSEQQGTEAETVLAESENQAEIPAAQPVENTATSGSQSLDSTLDVGDVDSKTELKARARVNLAALEFEGTELEITDAELAGKYRAFLNERASGLGAEETQRIQHKIDALEQSAEAFAALKAKDANISVCEAFDQWKAYQPRRTLGPEAQYRDLRLAELNALVPDSAVVTSQQNFITSRGKNDLELNDTFTLRKDKVYMHAWVNSPRRQAVTLKVRHGDTERSVWAGKWVERNPLRGERMGYHLWTWKGANKLGTYELLLYDANNRLICRREYEIVAASP